MNQDARYALATRKAGQLAVPPRDRWIEGIASRPLFAALGITGDNVGEGYARYRVSPLRAGAAEDGTVSTLAITTAADQALVAAISTLIVDGKEAMNGTAEMSITYLARATGAVVVDSRVLHKGERVSVMTVEARDESGAMVATGRGTYSIRPLRQDAP